MAALLAFTLFVGTEPLVFAGVFAYITRRSFARPVLCFAATSLCLAALYVFLFFVFVPKVVTHWIATATPGTFADWVLSNVPALPYLGTFVAFALIALPLLGLAAWWARRRVSAHHVP